MQWFKGRRRVGAIVALPLAVLVQPMPLSDATRQFGAGRSADFQNWVWRTQRAAMCCFFADELPKTGPCSPQPDLPRDAGRMVLAMQKKSIEKWVWILIYGGLLAVSLGWFVEPANAAPGMALMVGGGMLAAIGVVLIFVRARLGA